jgi:hypothetical protein
VSKAAKAPVNRLGYWQEEIDFAITHVAEVAGPSKPITVFVGTCITQGLPSHARRENYVPLPSNRLRSWIPHP